MNVGVHNLAALIERDGVAQAKSRSFFFFWKPVVSHDVVNNSHFRELKFHVNMAGSRTAPGSFLEQRSLVLRPFFTGSQWRAFVEHLAALSAGRTRYYVLSRQNRCPVYFSRQLGAR